MDSVKNSKPIVLAILLAIGLVTNVGAQGIPPELLGDSGIPNQSGGVKVFEDSVGGWALFGAGSADGKNCAVTYFSQGKILSFIGPDNEGSRGTILFAAPSIPAATRQREIRVRLATDADPANRPTSPGAGFYIPFEDGMGAVAIATSMEATLRGIARVQGVWLEVDAREIFRLERIGGIFVARDALARCMKLAPIATAPTPAPKGPRAKAGTRRP
jgi:hypothetical protein